MEHTKIIQDTLRELGIGKNYISQRRSHCHSAGTGRRRPVAPCEKGRLHTSSKAVQLHMERRRTEYPYGSGEGLEGKSGWVD